MMQKAADFRIYNVNIETTHLRTNNKHILSRKMEKGGKHCRILFR